jgi:hypothetical protein
LRPIEVLGDGAGFSQRWVARRAATPEIADRHQGILLSIACCLQIALCLSKAERFVARRLLRKNTINNRSVFEFHRIHDNARLFREFCCDTCQLL